MIKFVKLHDLDLPQFKTDLTALSAHNVSNSLKQLEIQYVVS
jgi:hypothetical protein